MHRFSIKFVFSFFLVSVFFASVKIQDAHGWARHHLITELALSELNSVQGESVIYTEFDEYLKLEGFSTSEQFNTSIEIRKDFVFNPKLNEKPGARVDLVQVISKYSDEPDWGMDIELFDQGQYPHLWRDEFAMMAGKERGAPSQAHRHMYWGKLKFLHLLKTVHIPNPFKPLGLSPDRAEVFLNLAESAKKSGQYYWAARFLGNALHYIEDISSPFHSTQLPSKKFLTRALKAKGKLFSFKDLVPKTINVVRYYHFAFEETVGELLRSHMTGKGRLGVQKLDAIFNGLKNDDSNYKGLQLNKNLNFKEVFVNLHRYSEKMSANAARASIEFFPEITGDPGKMDVPATMNKNWWAKVSTNVSSPKDKKQKKAREKIYQSVKGMFAPVGMAIRSLVDRHMGIQ